MWSTTFFFFLFLHQLKQYSFSGILRYKMSTKNQIEAITILIGLKFSTKLSDAEMVLWERSIETVSSVKNSPLT